MINHPLHSNPFPFTAPRGFWARALFGCYALLFAAVFPFICWGGLSGEDHPHLLPHFVFFEPISHTHTLSATPTRHIHPAASANQPSYEPSTSHPPIGPLGRAAPAMVIFALVLLFFSTSWLVLAQPQPLFLLRQTELFSTSIALAVPHPPPRLAPFAG